MKVIKPILKEIAFWVALLALAFVLSAVFNYIGVKTQ
jgi:uncharacterized membrane protein